MSINSIFNAAVSALDRMTDAAASGGSDVAREVESTAQAAIGAVSDAVAPAAVDALQWVASHPRAFGDQASELAGLLAQVYGSGQRDPLLPPEPLRNWISTATQL